MKSIKRRLKIQINLLLYCLPYLFVTKPRIDLCMTSQQNISLVMRTQNWTFRFGAETTYGPSEEVHTVKKKAFREIVDLNLNNYPVGINSVKANVTFSFDFPQTVHYPNNLDQVGCLYFRVPRKCSVLRVANEQTQFWS